MPLYEYKCDRCGARYEKLRRREDADRNLACPECGSERIVRMISTFATGGCSPNPAGGFT
jgi:putative FmdB family regulatory protein